MKMSKYLILSMLSIYAPAMSAMMDRRDMRNVDITLKIDHIISTTKNDITKCSATYNHIIMHSGCGCHCKPREACCKMVCEHYPSSITSTTVISQLPCTLHLDSSLSNFSISYQNKTFQLTPSQVTTIIDSKSGTIVHLNTKTGKFTIKPNHKKPTKTLSKTSPTQNLQSKTQDIYSQIKKAIASLQDAEKAAEAIIQTAA